VLRIEDPKKIKKSNQDVYDAVNQDKVQPPATPVGNPLDDLDQFEMPSIPSPQSETSEAPSPEIPSPQSETSEEPSYGASSYPAPSTEPSFQQPQISTDYIQQIAEEVVEEKWDELMSKVGDIRLWKDKIDNDITSIKQEIMRTQNHFANLQKAVLGKVSEYNENIININTEMKSLEKVFEKILQPLTSNIKELSKITNKLKTKKV